MRLPVSRTWGCRIGKPHPIVRQRGTGTSSDATRLQQQRASAPPLSRRSVAGRARRGSDTRCGAGPRLRHLAVIRHEHDPLSRDLLETPSGGLHPRAQPLGRASTRGPRCGLPALPRGVTQFAPARRRRSFRRSPRARRRGSKTPVISWCCSTVSSRKSRSARTVASSLTSKMSAVVSASWSSASHDGTTNMSPGHPQNTCPPITLCPVP